MASILALLEQYPDMKMYDQDGNPMSEEKLAELRREAEEFDDQTYMMGCEAIDSFHWGHPASSIKLIGKFAARFGSEVRLPNLLQIWEDAPPEVFWGSLARWWSGCDDTWDHLDDLLDLMRRYRWQSPSHRFLGRSVRVYRGCKPLKGARGRVEHQKSGCRGICAWASLHPKSGSSGRLGDDPAGWHLPADQHPWRTRGAARSGAAARYQG
jgi:hypothetical protein